MRKIVASIPRFLKYLYSLVNRSKRARNILNLGVQPAQRKSQGLSIDYAGQAASDIIKSMLANDAPCMIARFGATELGALCCYLNIQRKSRFPLEKTISYLTGNTPEFWWSDSIKSRMSVYSGFFPTTPRALEQFSRRMLEDSQQIDILGTWRTQESVMKDYIRQAKVMRLVELRPWEHANPWSEVLEDKVVLVIHPFDSSIQSQYLRREKLFDDQRILPKFELKTLKAVQSIAGSEVPFFTWFDALDWMCEQISNIQFDIAIIGAGAYGLPLAAFVKQMGKKSVHLGGVTQLFFGIKGKRWEEQNYLQTISNEYWIRPLSSEVPENAQAVERGCYW